MDMIFLFFFFFSSRRRHTRLQGDWSSDVCSSDLRETARREGCRCQITHPGGTVSTSPEDQLPALVVARAAEAPVFPMGDALFQRLLRHRIIFLGQQVDDELANRICAELVLLAAEDPRRDIN